MQISIIYQLKRKVGKQYVYGFTLFVEGRELTGEHREPALLPSLPLDAVLRGLQRKCRKGGNIGITNKCLSFFGEKYWNFRTMELENEKQ